ncbi:MAG: MarR family winged helix-turn-helix transcriptional regulator [Pseudomonadota bacterium]
MDRAFELSGFLPYMLNQAAERLSQEFSREYRERYGMVRTEWRVLFHLGAYGSMTANEICARSGEHKTKVSRAVSALEKKRFLTRAVETEDRRRQMLHLSATGQSAFSDLSASAEAFDRAIRERLTEEKAEELRACLAMLLENK